MFITWSSQQKKILSSYLTRKPIIMPNRPDSEPDNRPDSEPDNRPDSEPDNRPDSELDNRPDSELDNRPDSEPDNRPDNELDASSGDLNENILTDPSFKEKNTNTALFLPPGPHSFTYTSSCSLPPDDYPFDWLESDNDWEDIDQVYKPQKNYAVPDFQGPYGPYFPSYTSAAFSIFLKISQISRQHFNTFLEILRHDEFRVQDIPQSHKQCLRLLRSLPSLPIRLRHLPVTGNGTRSSSTTEPTYSYNVSDIVLRVLSTPYLRDHMHFGPGLKVSKPREFYHGLLWHESPMFGDENIRNENGIRN